MTTAAIVGCGDVAAVHLQAIEASDAVELVGVCDTDPGALAAAVERTGAPGFAAVGELLEAVRPDVVHVTTPHDAHVDVALADLGAGEGVIQEKPVAHTTRQARRLVDAVARLQDRLGPDAPKIAVCLQNRYNVSSVELRRLLDSGALGAVRGAYATVAWSRSPGYYPAKPWRGLWERAGGGLLMNQAPHTLDLIQWLLGDVVEVQGSVSTDKFSAVSEVEDTACARFTHADGATTCFYGTVNLSAHRPVELELDCERACVVLRDGLEVRWRDGRVERHEERTAGSRGRSYWGVSHELLIRDFYSRLDDPEPFWIGPAQAMACLLMAKAVYRAAGLPPTTCDE